MSRKRVYASIVEHGPSTTQAIADRLSLGYSTVRHHLYRLVIDGRVRECSSWPVRFEATSVGAVTIPVGERWLAAKRDGRVLVLDRGRAACAGMADELFFGRGWGRRAKRVCAGCPVSLACLDFAIRTDIEYGVFGGATPNERRRLARQLDGYSPVGVAELTET